MNNPGPTTGGARNIWNSKILIDIGIKTIKDNGIKNPVNNEIPTISSVH
jgi:hypothetical protein